MAKGDHIRVRRARWLYTHHGIDMGDGTVVHFSGEPTRLRDAVVCRISMTEFLQEGEAEVVSAENALPVEETLAQAERWIGVGGYDLIINNCEHFATWCKTGKRESRQARRLLKAAMAVTMVGGLLAGKVAAHVLRKQRG